MPVTDVHLETVEPAGGAELQASILRKGVDDWFQRGIGVAVVEEPGTWSDGG